MARSWGVEPEAFWAWSVRSRTLALALHELEAQTGPEGFPLDMELDPENDGWFQAEPIVNFAAAARERWIKDHDKADPGTRIVVRYTKVEEPNQEA